MTSTGDDAVGARPHKWVVPPHPLAGDEAMRWGYHPLAGESGADD
jgi:hypothetical protein